MKNLRNLIQTYTPKSLIIEKERLFSEYGVLLLNFILPLYCIFLLNFFSSIMPYNVSGTYSRHTTNESASQLEKNE